MKDKTQFSLKQWLLIGFALAFLFWFGFHSQSFGATDKSAYNLYGHSSPETPFDSTWCVFWDEHIDWQTTGKDDYYSCATRNQVIGSYELAHIFTGSDLVWLYAYFDSAGIHRDSGLAHFNQNTYYCPKEAASTTKRLTPGWDNANDVGGNWQRDWDADYDYNNATTYFTVQRTSAPYYIRDVSGGQAGISWATRNKWQNAYVKMGWGADADYFETTCDSSHADTLYLNTAPTSHTYLWFIVDDPSATNHNAVAMRDTCARIQTNSWGYWLINCKHWLMRQFAGRFFHSRVLDRPYQPSDIYPDDVLKSCCTWSCGSGWCDQIDMGGNCQEGLDDDDIWRPAQRTYLHQIKDSLKTDGFLLANAYEVNDGWDSVLYGGSVDGLWHEGWIDGNNYASHWASYYSNIRKWMQSPYGYNLHFFHAVSGTTNGDADRYKINCYAQYLLMYGDSVYFLLDTEPAYGGGLGDTTNWWFGLERRSIGTPTDTARAVSVSGQTIWERHFTNGIITWKPLPSSGSNYTDVTSGISLGGYYYQLTIDGNSTGDSINSISLMNAQSFIGIKPTGGAGPSDSLVQTYHKTDTTTTSISVLDSVLTLFSTYCDTIFFRINTSNNIATSTVKDTLANVSVGTLVASGLPSNTKHYIWLVAKDTGRADTTAVDSVTTKTEISSSGGKYWLIKK